VDIHFFFSGKLSREEASSAFLATLLEQSKYCFKKFLVTLNIDLPYTEIQSVVTEEHEIDILVKLNNDLIIIENKVKSAAKKEGQLAKYYKKMQKKYPQKRMIIVFLGPNSNLGDSEIEGLTLRDGDSAKSIGWDQILTALNGIVNQMSDPTFVKSGIVSVNKLLSSTLRRKYELSPDRDIMHSVIYGVKQSLNTAYSDLSFRIWPDINLYAILLNKSNLSLAFNLHFHSSPEKPYTVRAKEDDGRIKVELRAYVKLSEKGKKDRHAKQFWEKLSESETFNVGDKIKYTLVNGERFRWQKPLIASKEDVQAMLAEVSTSTINFLKENI
jgi:hypothetical protein